MAESIKHVACMAWHCGFSVLKKCVSRNDHCIPIIFYDFIRTLSQAFNREEDASLEKGMMQF